MKRAIFACTLLLGCGHTGASRGPAGLQNPPLIETPPMEALAAGAGSLSILTPPEAPPVCGLRSLPEQLLEGSLVDTLPEVGETTFALVSHPAHGTGMVTRGQQGPIVEYSGVHAHATYVDGLRTYFLATNPARLAVITWEQEQLTAQTPIQIEVPDDVKHFAVHEGHAVFVGEGWMGCMDLSIGELHRQPLPHTIESFVAGFATPAGCAALLMDDTGLPRRLALFRIAGQGPLERENATDSFVSDARRVGDRVYWANDDDELMARSIEAFSGVPEFRGPAASAGDLQGRRLAYGSSSGRTLLLSRDGEVHAYHAAARGLPPARFEVGRFATFIAPGSLQLAVGLDSSVEYNSGFHAYHYSATAQVQGAFASSPLDVASGAGDGREQGRAFPVHGPGGLGVVTDSTAGDPTRLIPLECVYPPPPISG